MALRWLHLFLIVLGALLSATAPASASTGCPHRAAHQMAPHSEQNPPSETSVARGCVRLMSDRANPSQHDPYLIHAGCCVGCAMPMNWSPERSAPARPALPEDWAFHPMLVSRSAHLDPPPPKFLV